MITKNTRHPVVQPLDVPHGTSEFEEKRAALLQAFWDKVPIEYYLPADIIDDPPINVSQIPSSCGILTAEEVKITENYDATGIAEAVATRKYTAVTVAKAFGKRSIICHQLTCCLTQWFMDSAIEQAKQLDAYLEKHGKTIGPLHGVPVSIKEHMPIAGTFSSQGMFSSIVKDEEDCQMIAILRSLGAVFYCKTNQPQTIMHLESDSHWGRVLNPFNIHLSAGGSTGGEAALIAMYGSPLGVGTDIGGSVRGPSAFCGIYGFKPTSYTLPMRKFLASAFPAELNILCSTGPMCRTLRDMDLFMTLVLSTKPYLTDPRIIPIPWSGLRTPTIQKLKIGIITNDGFIEPQPPVQRAISWAQAILSNPKYSDILDVKPFKPYNAKEAWSKIRRMYWPDAGKGEKDAIAAAGEPLHPLSQWIWKDAEETGMLDAVGVSQQRDERDEFRCKFAEHWCAQDVDVVIGPAFVGPACAHDSAFYWTYTSLYNLVDYPGVVFPTPITACADERYAEDYVPLSEECRHVKMLWDKGGFEGAPVDLQIVARKYHDNELFGALQVLREVLGLK
ncbi:amidase signature domain-containing protein [Massariosphaeria phaeospora]|uniref:Amidase signature domain-containing protein n=1 Tax=Massariosphaeria phaeospora TaxID=100035 RepID=A0A7C8I7R9_9PLEO|nr:amidase signature domain-containing protein [Massariosphaeria phaeospora]